MPALPLRQRRALATAEAEPFSRRTAIAFVERGYRLVSLVDAEAERLRRLQDSERHLTAGPQLARHQRPVHKLVHRRRATASEIRPSFR